MMFLAHGGCRTPTGGSGDFTEITLTQDECISYCASQPACLAVEIKPDDRCEVHASTISYTSDRRPDMLRKGGQPADNVARTAARRRRR